MDPIERMKRYLDEAKSEHVTRNLDEVTIRCANGEATYRIEACDVNDVYHTVAVKRMWRKEATDGP